uniref:LolO n=1 Tax=Epichloe aotearoae TaxID=170559 RepID=R9W3A8_EPIAO|nr:LolO [Epichloe aotearoae]
MTVTNKPVEPANVPVMDFEAIHASVGNERKKYLRQLDEAWSHHGAVYVINHSIGTETLEEAFAWCKKFFDLPLAVKNSVHIPPDVSKHFQGWTGTGEAISSQGVWDPDEIERLRKEMPTELKEAMELQDPCGTYPPGNPDLNLVEQHLPGYLDFLKKWFAACYKQSLQNMRLVCEILGMEDLDYIGKKFEPRHMSTHSTWNYFLGQPVSQLASGSANRLNAHTDYCQFTMLFQDMVGGLELHDYEEDIYRPVPPIKGAMIVQVGDLLEKQTNGRWRSALHRVTAPSRYMYEGSPGGDDELVQRYSLVFFGHLNLDEMIKPLPGCEKPGKWSTLEWKDLMTAGQWLARRVALEYERKTAATVM